MTTGYAYGGGNFVQEKDGTGTPTANLLTGGLDRLFSRTDASGPRYPFIDAVGSTIALSDSAGTVVTSYTYEPFGKTTASGASSSNSQQYTGRENDGPLYFYRARYLHPTFGRFASEDPAGHVGSGTNLYAYVGNDPMDRVDPTGQFGWFAFGVGCLLGVGGYLVGTVFSNDLNGKCDSPSILGGLGACVTGGVSAAFGGGVFEKAFRGFVAAAMGNVLSQATSSSPPASAGPINVRGATSFAVAGAAGAISNAIDVGSPVQGLIVAGVAGAVEPAVNKFIDDVLRSIRFR